MGRLLNQRWNHRGTFGAKLNCSNWWFHDYEFSEFGASVSPNCRLTSLVVVYYYVGVYNGAWPATEALPFVDIFLQPVRSGRSRNDSDQPRFLFMLGLRVALALWQCDVFVHKTCPRRHFARKA